MRKNLILAGDVVAYGALIGWFKAGWWIKLLGFSTYHSRGDAWLATPPAALNLLMGMVLPAAFLFGAVYLLASIFAFGRSSRADGERFMTEVFYGDCNRLLVKYFAFLLSALIVPFVAYSIRKTHPERLFTIIAAFAIMLVVFIVVVFIANLVLSRLTSPRITAGNPHPSV